MNRDEPMTPQQLETRIAVHSLKESATLWRTAEGRMNWRNAISFVAPILMLIFGVAQLLEGKEPTRLSPDIVGIVLMVFAVVSLVLTIWGVQQSRLNAILEILRRQERIRS